MNKTELLTYEAPFISEYVSIGWIQTILARYLAWKINRKLARYEKRLERVRFIKSNVVNKHE